MPAALELVLLFTLIPFLTTVVGGALPAVALPGPAMRSSIQHFAAGMIFAAVASELLPEIREGAPIPVVVGFAVGTVLTLNLKWFTERIWRVSPMESEGPLGLLATVGVDIFVDGLLLGIGFATGIKQGILLTAAISFEGIFLGLAAGLALSRAGASVARLIGVTAGLALLLPLGSALGITLLAGLSGPALAGVIAFAAAALLYLVTEELLVEAHEGPENALIAGTFFLGFLVLLMLEMLA